MIDINHPQVKIGHAGREDRALLRSNPSARSGAGTRADAVTPKTFRPPVPFTIWLQCEKPRGNLDRHPRFTSALRHMSLSMGLKRKSGRDGCAGSGDRALRCEAVLTITHVGANRMKTVANASGSSIPHVRKERAGRPRSQALLLALLHRSNETVGFCDNDIQS